MTHRFFLTQSGPIQHIQGFFVGHHGREGRDGFAVAKVRRRASGATLSLKEKLVQTLRARGPSDACFFAPERMQHGGTTGLRAGLPDLIIVSKGRAFGLELKNADGRLTSSERTAQLALRDAGMRIEVARSLGEALEHLRDMGIALKPREDAAALFGRRG